MKDERLHKEETFVPKSWISPQEISIFRSLYQPGTYLEALTYLRNLYATRMDREFLDSFIKIHWAAKQNLEQLLASPRSNLEISCQAYKAPPYICGFVSGVGVLMQGRTVFAGNGDLQTNQWSRLTQETGGRRFTEYFDRLFVNRDDCKTPYEFVLGDWAIKAIVVDSDKARFGTKEGDFDWGDIHDAAKKISVPVLDIKGKKI